MGADFPVFLHPKTGDEYALARTERKPALLLSASAKYPDGLANSSGQVGRNYMRHTTGSVYAIFDKPVRMWRGTTMAESGASSPNGASCSM